MRLKRCAGGRKADPVRQFPEQGDKLLPLSVRHLANDHRARLEAFAPQAMRLHDLVLVKQKMDIADRTQRLPDTGKTEKLMCRNQNLVLAEQERAARAGQKHPMLGG